MSKNLFSHRPVSPGGDVHNVQQGRLALRWGKVVELSPEHSQVRVETDELDEIPSYWLSILYPKTWHDKFYWMPELDEHVWFLWDEQGEEGVILGAFYCAEVPLSERHEPTPHKTEIHWGDESFFIYDRAEHRGEWNVRGQVEIRAKDGRMELEATDDLHLHGKTITLEACERITLRAPLIILEGAVTMNGGAGGIAMMGASFMAGGIPIAGIGSAVAGGRVVSGIPGLAGGSGGGEVGCPEPETAAEVEVEQEGDLRRLMGYTPPGFGNA
ncbi:MAG: phage baseplate assembly protein V [Spirulina sp.]